MRRALQVFLIVVFCMSLFHFGGAHAGGKTLSEFFDEKDATKAYISKVKNSTGDRNVNINRVKKSIEKALTVRRSHTFKIVRSERSADIIIEVDVVEYFWTEKDPVEVIFPPMAAAIDGAKNENYARLAANITVKNAKNHRRLWSDKVRSSLTDDTMAKKESYGLVAETLAKDFVARLCRKPRKR